jgi:uncharacterized protein YbjT (DUF2867 family)
MPLTFLVVEATDKTGPAMARTLYEQLTSNHTFFDYRILALTRSPTSLVAQDLTRLPHVEVAEYNWSEITSTWLREHEVTKSFIASHNLPNHFDEESTFHLAALRAGAEYVVRISTTAANVRPDYDAYYPRTHLAIEAMLSAPEFSGLRCTSLQPNVFIPLYIQPAVDLIKKVRNGE